MISRTSYFTISLLFNLSISVLGQNVSTLPAFSFIDHEGRKIESELFRNDKPLIIFYFEPTCAHCKLQAEWVASNIDKFDNVDLLWVAWESTEDIPDFQSRFFPQVENVYYAIDIDAVFDDLFGFSQLATVFIYDSQNRLVKKFKKETKAEKLLRTLGLDGR